MGTRNNLINQLGRALKIKKLLRIAYMDCPRMGGVRRVDWCTRQPTRRALKTRGYSGLHTGIGHALEVFDWWTGALVNRLVEP